MSKAPSSSMPIAIMLTLTIALSPQAIASRSPGRESPARNRAVTTLSSPRMERGPGQALVHLWALDSSSRALQNRVSGTQLYRTGSLQTDGAGSSEGQQSTGPFPDGDPKISGRLFSAATLQPLPNLRVQLCPQEGCNGSTTTTTDANGYYQFVFGSILEVVTDTEQIGGNFTPGEIRVQPEGGPFKAIFSVNYSADDYHNEKNKHQLAYIYPSRESWGWERKQEGLHQYFILHPPHDLPLPTEIEPTKTPLLLVHGHGGKDSTWSGLRPPLEALGYQTWEVYYPSRDAVVEGAAALRDAVEVVLRHYAADQVDMVTHSMGGPVSRSYVSGTARHPWTAGEAPLAVYTPKVRKLLQLAPPSWGVLNLVRLTDPPWSNRCAAVLELLQILGYQNPGEPALQDLALGSRFYEELHGHRVPLAAEDFLIVAGTNSPLRLCQEARNQSDQLIGNSSSSLLNQGVPLGLVYRDHSEMVGHTGIRLSPWWRPGTQPPSDHDDNPYNDAAQLVQVIDAFLQGDMRRVKQNLDVFVDPGDSPWLAQTWEVTVVDRTTGPPRLETRTNWPANQWNDGHSDTDFDAGGFLLRFDTRGDAGVPAAKLRICDQVHDQCWELRQASTTGVWFVDGTDWGYVLPASEFGYPYMVLATVGGQDIELGQFSIKPLQLQFATLSRLYFPIAFKASAANR